MITPDDLQVALAARTYTVLPALPGRTNHIRAGVMVPIVWEPEPVVLLTLRPHSIGHGGEISFPGGRPEPADLDLEATARRETEEELGIVSARVLGRLSSIPVYTSEHRLEPFVADVTGAPVTPSPAEVEEVVALPLRRVLDAPHIDALTWTWPGESEEHVMPVPSVVSEASGGELVVFGATGFALMELLGVVAEALQRPLPPIRTGRYGWQDLRDHGARAGLVKPPL